MTDQPIDDDVFPRTVPTLPHQIRAIERELRYRERVYPRLIAQGKMSMADADWQIRCILATLATLRRLDSTEATAPPAQA